MKTNKIIRFILTVIFVTTVHSFGIEGLQIAVPGTNAVLWWPSDTSETYLVQYRHTLSVTDSWTTLADFYPPDFSGSNITYFTDTNFVDFGSGVGDGGGTNGGGGIQPMMATGASGVASSEPMVLETNGDMVPLILFPPGTDLSGMTIIDPSTGQSVSGSGLVMANGGTASPNGFQPDGASGSSTNSPGTGFYQVVRDGAHLYGLTNGEVLSGIVHLPVELGNSGGTVTVMSLTENDATVGNSIQVPPLNSPLALVVDTTQMANGVHNVSANATWDDSNGNEWDATSPPITITTSNEITFENWMPTFGETGNSLLIRATSAHTNVDWAIDVYDSSNTYIGTLGGHTPDGDIYVVWNLVGPDNVAHTNDAFFNFYITTPYIDPPTPPTYRVTDPWPAIGAWCEVSQHAFDNILDSQSIYDELNGFVGIAGAMGAQLFPPQSSDGSPYALTFGTDNPQGDTDWANFRQALYNRLSRNLVYFGHGSPFGFGYNTNSTNRSISAGEIAAALHTIPAGQTNRHAFRFVFVDACSTASGKLPESFGIQHKENVPEIDYLNSSSRPSAYVG